jgi:hypothetical protein
MATTGEVSWLSEKSKERAAAIPHESGMPSSRVFAWDR